MRHALLRAALIARCIASVAFVGWMSATPASYVAILRPFGWFALVDGVLALATAALALGIPVLRGGVALVAALNGLWLIAAAAALWLGPGIPDFGLTLVLYVGLAAVCALFVGLLRLNEARRLARVAGRNSLSAALSVAGIASAAFGVAAFLMQPSPEVARWLLMTAAAIEGLALFAVALRELPPAPHALPAR